MKRLVSALCVAVMGGLLFWGAQTDVIGTAVTVGEEELSQMWVAEEELLSITDYELAERVTLCDYRNLAVDVPYIPVDNEYIVNAIDQMLASYPDYKVTEKQQVEDGDLVNIDYVGTVDGEEFDGGSAQGDHLEIGSGRFIDGFEEGLIGANVGDTVTLNLTFPEEYDESLAGKDAVFTVTVNSIDEEVTYTYEELTDDFVSNNFGYDTVGEFYQYVKNYYEDSMESTKQSDARSALLEQLSAECEVDVPQELLENRVKDYLSSFKGSVEQVGSTVTEYLAYNYGYTPTDFEQQVTSMMEESIKQQMILAAIAEQEAITADEQGFTEYVDSYVNYYGYESRDALFEEFPEQELNLAYLCNKVVDNLQEQCTINFIESE